MTPPSAQTPPPPVPIKKGTWLPAEELQGPRYSQSLARGLTMLQCFSARRPVLGIADVADMLGMSRSTTHRYMTTLVELGYLEQFSNRKYRLSLKPLDLGMSALRATGLRDTAHPFLEQLRNDTGQNAGLAVLSDSGVLYVDVIHGKHTSLSVGDGPIIRTGVRLPAHCTSAGKILLTHLPEPEQRHALVEMELTKYTKHTITRRKRLKEQLAQTATQGYATSDQELYPGVRSIAVPIRKDETVVAALDLTTHDETITTDTLCEVYIPLLQATAERVSLICSYRSILKGDGNK